MTLKYNPRSVQTQKKSEHVLSVGFSKVVAAKQAVRKSRLEQSLEDVDNGNVFFLAGPSKP